MAKRRRPGSAFQGMIDLETILGVELKPTRSPRVAPAAMVAPAPDVGSAPDVENAATSASPSVAPVIAEFLTKAAPAELAAPAISRAEALMAEVAALDPIRELGRVNPFQDEACAALFGLDRWATYLEATGSGVVRDVDGRRDYDFALPGPTARFDLKSKRLVATGGEMRVPRFRQLFATHLRLQNTTDDAGREREASRFDGAIGPVGPDLVLPGADALPSDWRMCSAGPEPDVALANALRLMLEADERGIGRIYAEGEQLVDPDDPSSFAEEMLARTVQALQLARFAGAMFDVAIFSLPYFGIVERHALRFMSCAGMTMAQVALLLEARLPSGRDRSPTFLTALPGAPGDTPAVFAPRPVGGVFDADWCEAAYKRVRAFFPFTPKHDHLHDADQAYHPYRGADLAEGLEHARCFAFAQLAIAAVRAGVTGSTGADPSSAEMAFWRDGVEEVGVDHWAAHAFTPMLATSRHRHGLDHP